MYERLDREQASFESLRLQDQEALADAERQRQAIQQFNEAWPEDQPEVGGGEPLTMQKVDDLFKSERWYPRQHLPSYSVEFRYKDFPLHPGYTRSVVRERINGETRPQDGGYHYRHRKVIMRVDMRAFEMPPPVRERFEQLVGPRYDKNARVLTLVADNLNTRSSNTHYVKTLFRNIMHESWLADPSYVVAPEAEAASAEPFVPSSEAAKVVPATPEGTGLHLFHVVGYPSQAVHDTQRRDIDHLIAKSLGSSSSQ
eukprot:TRINITY_DN3349_c0_g1_i9.p1 TRINITY_DN3349_c0_g1~~TRINITY_DN3349_c0_g1_i9.p1  ORF type:complete len:256 (-),score=66.16 TRINITY_DN3349_c0_g1_i9:25-792(-)